MGSRNALTAHLLWAHLDHGPRGVLVYMGLVALDQTDKGRPARVYWAGHDDIARAMGLCDWDSEPTPSNLRVVRRWVAVLVDAGAVKVRTRGERGRQASYDLNLDALRKW